MPSPEHDTDDQQDQHLRVLAHEVGDLSHLLHAATDRRCGRSLPKCWDDNSENDGEPITQQGLAELKAELGLETTGRREIAQRILPLAATGT